MKHTRSLQLSFVMALAAVLAAAPADAQGKGKGHGGGKHRTEVVRRERDRDDDDRYDRRERDDDRWDDNVRLQRRNGSVPPGWCRGKGNPHNTVENCGYSGSSRSNRRYDDRNDGRYDRRSDTGRYGSYDEAHRAFHYDHDRICRERASQRPLDVRWQLQVRSECRAEHDQWHAQYDRRRY